MYFTAQSGSGIPRSPYQDEIELRGQFNLRSPFHGLKNRCKNICVPPSSCPVSFLFLPLKCLPLVSGYRTSPQYVKKQYAGDDMITINHS